MHQKIKCFYLFVFLLAPYSAQASHGCSKWLAKIVSLQGKVDTQFSGRSDWHTINRDETFCSGDKIRTAHHSRATLVFSNESRATLDQNTTLTFVAHNKETPSWYLNLLQGSTFFRSRQPQHLNIQTPFINAVHEGTEFLVSVDSQQTEISVFDGQVAANNKMGEIQINKGYIGIARKNQPPHIQVLKIRPEDAVQWTLYYPPIIDFQNPELSNRDDLQPAINAYQQGDIYQAINRLENMPATQQNTSYLTLKSSLLLTVGSVDEALNLINKVLVLEPRNSTAFALQSVIAVTKNRQGKALSLAQEAVTLDPKSSVAQIALSYAYQSGFKIESALEATQEAVRLSPDNALAWARLSELQLSTGERSDALKSAQKAQQLNPRLDRTQTILGFSYLAQIDIDEAKIAFSKAINLNSADPLARLGLGLAKIRKSDIEEGTRDIESAVSLDPDNAIMRSYLGKAYYELRNEEYAATELGIAKEMDPKDPTPWFYDGILKQSTNRPVEALHDMQRAIELNDNRGVYRSQLLLDEDAAARSANMARIYQDLDFDRVALKQAWTSLGQNYTNPSAHRFLSDTLQGRPRQRIARASELLQAQLFQPINTVPVQPQLTSENIGILNSTGPGSLSSNEYDPLFTSNGAHILLNGAVGSNNTLTDSAIISGVYDQFSLSFGQFHFQTDGFRNNDDYEQNIYNAFAQVAITPDFNIQVEFKSEDVTAGDVPLRFNGFHQENLRQSIDQDTARFGMRFKISPKQDFVLSAFYTTFKEIEKNQVDEITQRTTRVQIDTTKNSTVADSSGYQAESQHLFHPDSLTLITGIGYINLRDRVSDQKIETRTILRNSGARTFRIRSQDLSIDNIETHHFNSYIYSQIEISPQFISTLGISFDLYDEGKVNKRQLNPKLGLIWNPVSNLTLRGAAFRTLKKPLLTNQTIEPSQVAGFNQFFDGNNGTTAWHYGFGLDLQPLKNLSLGGELQWRDTVQPLFSSNDIFNQDRDEVSHLAYLYWAPLDWLAISTEYHFEEFRREFTIGKGDTTNPRSVQTHSVPFTINLYHQNGGFTNFTANYVNQKTEFVRPEEEFDGSGSDFINGDSNSFLTFDLNLGFRLPKKFGSLSLEVRNLFDKKNFKYNSVFDASGPQITRFVPEREIFLKLNLLY